MTTLINGRTLYSWSHYRATNPCEASSSFWADKKRGSYGPALCHCLHVGTREEKCKALLAAQRCKTSNPRKMLYSKEVFYEAQQWLLV